MPSCAFCQIDIVDGTTNTDKCSENHHPYKIYSHCCNCYNEKTPWADSEHACLHCKNRVAQVADLTTEFDAAVAKAVAKALTEKLTEKEATKQAHAAEFDAAVATAVAKALTVKPTAEKLSAAKKKRRREEAKQLDGAVGG